MEGFVVKKLCFRAITAAIFVVMAFSGVSSAYNFPERNIDVIIPTGEGGTLDRAVRAFTNVWSEHLGTTFQSSFHPGASGEVGYRLFMGRPADGYTLLAGNIGPEILMYAMQNPDYNFPEDFVYFGTMDADPVVIWVHRDSPFQTIHDLIEAAQQRMVTLSTSRFPHPATLAALLLARETGADFNIISYGGGGPTRMAAFTMEVDAATTHLSASYDLSDEIRFLIMSNYENHWGEISNNAPTPMEAFNLDMPSLGANRAWAVRREFKENYPERFQRLVDTFQQTMNDPRLVEEWKRAGFLPSFLNKLNEEESMALAMDTLRLAEEYRDIMMGRD